MPPRTETPGPIPKEALAYFNAKGLAPAFSYLDVWKEEHTVAFTVAKVLESDLLADVKESLSRALEEGESFKTWAKGIRPTLDQSGWTAYVKKPDVPRRLYTIYATNQRVARAVGQWDRIQRVKQFREFLVYGLGPSERHRPLHVDWSGTILPVDDPWWDDHMPPNGWG